MDPLLIVLIGMAVVIGAILWLRWPAFLALIVAAVVVAALPVRPTLSWIQPALTTAAPAWPAAAKQPQPDPYLTPLGERLGKGFGDTCGSIGILIAMASIVGKCLLDSGAADRIIRSLLRWLGEARAGLAFLFSGFLLGIPVFFDTVFYLMMPLGKALHLRTGKNYLFYIMTIVAGATMAHSLVPPTPGPLFVADRLGVDLGVMILAGSVVGLITAGAGFLFAAFMNRRLSIPLRDSEDASVASLQQLMAADERSLPPLWLSLAPILLPVVLIAGRTVADSLLGKAGHLDGWRWWLTTLGNSNVALMLSAGLALALVAGRRRHAALPNQGNLSQGVAAALTSAGGILLITGAGGAFGAVIRDTGVGERIRDLTGGQVPLLPLAFFVTVLIRSAQGSATVAMMTAVVIVQDLASPADLTFHPVYLALAIGCGSKPFAWMNDSGFWVITRMSGLTESEGLRTITPMSGIMGFTGLGVLVAGAALVPLV